MTSPIFVVGANRSGTTLLRLVLNAHSRIAIPEELVYFDDAIAGVDIRGWRHPGLSRAQYADLVAAFLEGKKEVLKPLEIDALQRCIFERDVIDLRSPYQLTLEAWARHHGKQRWGEKTPGNLFYADVIVDMFPDARFIYIARDPRAGVASMLEASFFPEDVVFNALNRHKHHTVGRAILERHVPASQRMIIRYEDLVASPVEVIQAVCGFLGEPYEPGMLRFYEESSRYMKQEAAASYNAAATGPISPRQAEKWRARLTRGQVAVIEKICASEMEAFGYSFDRHTMGLPDRLQVLLKTAYWHVQCWRNRHIRHYTVLDPMFARLRARLRGVKRLLAG